MIRDSQTGVWEAAALVATAVSTNAIDLGAPYVASTLQRDPSVGEPLVFILTVGVSATVNGTQTYEFDVVCADDVNLSTNLTTLAQYAFTTVQAGVILVAGASPINFPVPQGAVTRRYLGMKFVGANTPSVTVTAWCAPASMSQMTRNYGTLIQVL